jgi:hypothetical protein
MVQDRRGVNLKALPDSRQGLSGAVESAGFLDARSS